jgi:hypothetical protein
MPGMSKEFIEWLVANGYCSGEGGDGCAHGHIECSTDGCDTGCAIAVMWPKVEFGLFLDGQNVISVECIRTTTGPFGFPDSIMYTKHLRQLMPKEMADIYEESRREHSYQAQFFTLQQRVRRAIEICEIAHDIEARPVTDAILRQLKGEDSAT